MELRIVQGELSQPLYGKRDRLRERWVIYPPRSPPSCVCSISNFLECRLELEKDINNKQTLTLRSLIHSVAQDAIEGKRGQGLWVDRRLID